VQGKGNPTRQRLLVWSETYRVGGSDRFLVDLLGGIGESIEVVLAGNRNDELGGWLARRLATPPARTTLPIANLVDSPLARLRARATEPAPVPLAEESPAQPTASAVAIGTAALRYRAAAVNYVRLRRLLERLRPAALLVNNGGYPGAESCRVISLAARRADVPTIVHFVHNMAYPPAWPAAAERRFDLAVDRAVTTWATAADRAGDALAQRRGLPRERVETAYYGIPDGGVTLQDGARAALREELGFGPADLGVVVVAAFERRKGHDVLLHALTRVAPDVRAAFVGRGEQEPALRQLVHSLGLADRVRFTGWREDVPKLLASADALVLPSLGNECLPYAILEAMQQRLPVVATRVAGIPEEVEDGVTGTIVAPNDVGALATAIAELAADRPRAAALGEAGAARQRRMFSRDAMVERLLHLLRIGRSRR
jgi:glycosyltransferase involved in cell wall biosynthesis